MPPEKPALCCKSCEFLSANPEITESNAGDAADAASAETSIPPAASVSSGR